MPSFVDVAAVGIGGKPLAGRERIAAGTMEGELAVRAAHREGAAVGGDEHIRHRRACGQHERQHHKGRAAPAQRRLQKPDDQKTGRRKQKRSGPERCDAAKRARQACDPQGDRVHPLDAVAHLPPEEGVEAERNGDHTDDAHRETLLH